MRMQRRRKKGQTEAASAPPVQAQFQSRPFQDANTLTNKQAAPPEMQLQSEQQGFNFASIPLFAHNNTSSQPIQRQEDPNLQMKPEPDAIQRMGKDDDEMQMKPEPDAIQRMGEDDEMQMKPESNGAINPLLKNLVQRDHLETPVPRIPIQAQLTIGAPGDKYEQEADQVAHNVVEQINAPAPNANHSDTSVQREMVEEDDQMQMKSIVQRQELDGGIEAPTEVESSISQAKGGGQSLDAGLQRSMGQAMGADFSGVKVHTDNQADTLNQSLQAKAFTTGQHVFFKKGEYQPGNQGGQELIAHELTHVVQQSGNTNQVQRLVMDEKSGGNMDKQLAVNVLTTYINQKIDSDNDIHESKKQSLKNKVELFAGLIVRYEGHGGRGIRDATQQPAQMIATVWTVDEAKAECDAALDIFKRWENIGSDTIEDDSDEDPFADYTFGGEQAAVYDPQSEKTEKWDDAKNNWAIIDLVQRIGTKRKGGVLSSGKMNENRIICAVSAAGIASGFSGDPIQDPKKIITGVGIMNILLHNLGKQANALGADQAHAIAQQFASLNNTKVSKLYEVAPWKGTDFDPDAENGMENWRNLMNRKNPEIVEVTNAWKAKCQEVYNNMVGQLQDGDVLYIGFSKEPDIKQENGNEVLKKHGHAFCIVKSGNDLRKIETNGDRVKGPNIQEYSENWRSAYKLSYFIVKRVPQDTEQASE